MTAPDLFRLLADAAPVAGLAYAGLCGGLWLRQRRIIFRRGRGTPDPSAAGLPGLTVPAIRTEDGLDLAAWFVAPRTEAAPVVLFLHGNTGHVGHRAGRAARLAREGWGVMLAPYRGFGGNPGAPSEEGLARDARAAYAALREQGIAAGRIVIWGESLGSAVAVRLATEVPAAALILESPFTSMLAMARRRHPYVPARWLLKDRFDSLSRIGRVTAPLLIIQGARDALVPPAMGEHLRRAAGSAVRRIWRAPAAGHNDLFEHGAVEAGIAFIATLPRA